MELFSVEINEELLLKQLIKAWMGFDLKSAKAFAKANPAFIAKMSEIFNGDKGNGGGGGGESKETPKQEVKPAPKVEQSPTSSALPAPTPKDNAEKAVIIKPKSKPAPAKSSEVPDYCKLDEKFANVSAAISKANAIYEGAADKPPISKELWCRYICKKFEVLRKKGKTLTPNILNKNFKELYELDKFGINPTERVENAIAYEWQGLFFANEKANWQNEQRNKPSWDRKNLNANFDRNSKNDDLIIECCEI